MRLSNSTTTSPFFQTRTQSLLFFLPILVLMFLLLPSISSATSLEDGRKIFVDNCNVCHLQGNNIIIPEKNLKLDTLQMNGMDNLDAIVYQVTNGKNGMPAFGGRLKEEEIESVANYVLQEAAHF